MKREDKLLRFGKNLKANRKKAKLTQAQLAEKINVDNRTIQKFEAGDSNITILNIYALAEALKISPSELL